MRSELITDSQPSAAVIGCELGAAFDFPPLHSAIEIPDGDTPRWTRYYDGIELGVDSVSSKYGDGWITRFHPELTSPARVRRNDLIGDAKAMAAAHRSGKTTSRLVYRPTFENRQLPSTKGSNAADYTLVVAGWQLTYAVEDRDGGVSIDAYTGAVVDDWSNRVD
jgi:hypothetical protein